MSCKCDVPYNRALRDILRAILCVPDEGPEEIGSAVVSLRIAGFQLTFLGDFAMKLPDDKTVAASVAFVDAKGNAALVDGVPVWGTDRPDLLSVVPSEDGLSATVAPVGPLGSGQVTVTADADLGEGTVELVVLGSVEVVAGTAVAGTINFGEPA